MENSTCLRVGFSPYYPYVNPCIFHKQKPCTQTGKGGNNVDLINTLAGQVLGFPCITYVKSVMFRDYNPSKPPQQWAGLIGMLWRNQIDVTGSILYTDEVNVFPFVDYSLPVKSSVKGIVQQSHVDDEQIKIQNSNLFFRPFTISLWQLIVLMAIIFAVLNAVLIHLKLSGGKLCSRTQNVLNLFLALATFVLFRAYKAKFYASRVLITHSKLQFQSMNDLVAGLYGGTARYVQLARFKSHLNPNRTDLACLTALRNVYAARPDVVEFVGNMPAVLSKISHSTNPSYVTITSESTFRSVASTNGYKNLAFAPLPQCDRFLAYAFKKHSRLRHLFNWALYNRAYTVSDFDKEFLNVYNPAQKLDERKSGAKMRHSKNPMTVVEFYAALYVYVFIPLASMVICGLEVLSHRETKAM